MLKFVIALWLNAFVLNAYCLTETPSMRLEKKLHALKSMTADFSQSVVQKKDRINASGKMAMLRPGRFLWQTVNPTPQILLADGKKIYLYDKELEQVIIQSQKKHLTGSAAVFLGVDEYSIDKEYRVVERIQSSKQCYELTALSHQDSIVGLTLCFKQGVLMEMDLFDQLGQHTHIQLTHVKANINLSPSLFQLHIPKGTDVVKQ